MQPFNHEIFHAQNQRHSEIPSRDILHDQRIQQSVHQQHFGP